MSDIAAPLAACETMTEARRRLMIGLYAVIGVLYWMSLYTYVPTLSTYAKTKTDNLALVGVVVSMYGLWQGVVRLPLGIVADWVGRRKPFIGLGLACALLGAWVMGTTGTIHGLIVGRAITGLAAGAWVPLIVVFCSLFPPREAVRATTLLGLFSSLGQAIATAANGTLNDVGGYPLAFFAAMALAVLALPVLLPAHEDRQAPRRPSPAGVYHLITRRDVLLPAVLAAVSMFSSWAATFSFSPILAKGLGASDVTLSLMMSMNIALGLLGTLVTAMVVKKAGAQRLVYISFCLIAVGTAGVALAPTLPLLIVGQALLGLSQGVGAPVLMGMSIQNVAQAERATATGLHQSTYAILGMFGGPALGGVMAHAMGIRPMFIVVAVASLAVGWSLNWWLGRKQERSEARRTRSGAKG